MSGELQVVFIYDTLRCRKEEDDPREAILYFHPEEISESRRIAICGQLMGITHFLIDFFTAPKILTLENGKFALRNFGRQYVLALGCSSVTPDWLLEKQADILYHLTRFFHKDIDSILKTVNGDRHLLSAKLASIMDHYIPISQHHGDLFALTFGILPILNLPKSASHISLNATVILQTCMLRDGVLGGIVMFQNKVVGVELIQEVAQKLAFIQPYQLPPADAAKPSFNLPPGVQLLTVYIKHQDLQNLKRHSSTYQYPSRCEPNLLNGKENSLKGKIDPIREEDPSDISSSLGFSEPSTGSNPSEEHHGLDNSLTYSSLGTEDKEPLCSGANLMKSLTISDTSKATAVEKWKMDNDARGGIEEDNIKRRFSSTGVPPCVHKNGCGSNFLHPPRIFQSLENLTVTQDEETTKRSFSNSLTDPYFPYIRCDGKIISKALLNVYAYPDDQHLDDIEDELVIEKVEENYHKLSQSESNTTGYDNKLLGDDNKSDSTGYTKSDHQRQRSNSDLVNGCTEAREDDVHRWATDSKHSKTEGVENIEVEKSDLEMTKIPISKPTGISRPKDLALNTSSTRSKSKRRWSTFDDMMSPLIENPPTVIEMDNYPREKSASFSHTDPELFKRPDKDDPLIRTRLINSFRKLSSPEDISSFHSSSDNEPKPIMINRGDLDKPLKFGKLNQFPQLDNKNSSKTKKNVATKKFSPENPETYENALLFIYSLGGMRLLLLLEKDCLSDSDLIQSLWDYGSSSIAELEVAVSNIEEQGMSMGGSHHDHYCYLHYEPVWRSLAHGGRNHSMDFDVVQHMHQDFQIYPNINELIIRGEDHVVYGYQCVGSEVFYQQSAGPQPGLPMPTDLMGKVPLKAKRRLERDHNILLL